MGSAYQSTDEDRILDSDSMSETSDYDSECEQELESDEFADSASEVGQRLHFFGAPVVEPHTGVLRSKSALEA